jgi:hypothetical protein
MSFSLSITAAAAEEAKAKVSAEGLTCPLGQTVADQINAMIDTAAAGGRKVNVSSYGHLAADTQEQSLHITVTPTT